jgi:hypothetical protein
MNAPSPTSASLQPYGLVSLWDMLEIKALQFYNAITAFQRLHDMMEYNQTARSTKEELLDVLRDLEAPCNALGAKFTIKAIGELCLFTEVNFLSYGDTAKAVWEIRRRFRDELEECKLFGMDSRECEFFDARISPSILDAFPRACFDIQEAGKCIALGRATAAVLHLMRALEQPLQAMAKAVGVPVKDNWNKILNDVEKKVRGKNDDGDRTGYWDGRKEEQAFFAEASTHFFQIKNAWRNYANHGVKEKYTAEEAKTIYASVKSFFEHLEHRAFNRTHSLRH